MQKKVNFTPFKPFKTTKTKKVLSRVAKRKIYLPKKPKVGMLQINGRTYRVGTSKIEQRWLDFLGIKERQKVIYGFAGKVIVVDGIDLHNRIIYEMLGGHAHGSIKTYPTNRDTKTWLGKTPNEMYYGTINRFNFLRGLGYKIFFTWDYEYRTGKTLGRFYRGQGDNLY